jgi:hypothetical protein
MWGDKRNCPDSRVGEGKDSLGYHLKGKRKVSCKAKEHSITDATAAAAWIWGKG